MTLVASFLRAVGAGVELDVTVRPRASRSGLAGVFDGRLKVLLAAPPVDGEANAELVELFAKTFGVSKRDVRLVRGETSKRKTVALSGVTLDDAAARLAGAVS